MAGDVEAAIEAAQAASEEQREQQREQVDKQSFRRMYQAPWCNSTYQTVQLEWFNGLTVGCALLV